jgi:hypothetical protein
MDPLLFAMGICCVVALLSARQRAQLRRARTPEEKKALIAEWQRHGGRDCGGWDPSWGKAIDWAQCDPKTIPRSTRKRLGPQIATARAAARRTR